MAIELERKHLNQSAMRENVSLSLSFKEKRISSRPSYTLNREPQQLGVVDSGGHQHTTATTCAERATCC